MSQNPELVLPTIFYLVRHGESEANVQALLGEVFHPSHWHECDLSLHGVQQAENVSTLLASVSFHAIFSSDALRAQKTAEIIATRRKLPVSTSARLRETSAGESSPQFKELGYEDKITYCLDADDETYEEAGKRLIAFIRELCTGYPGLAILIVTHGALIKSFLISVGYATVDELPHGSIANTSYVIGSVDGGHISITDTIGIKKDKRSYTNSTAD